MRLTLALLLACALSGCATSGSTDSFHRCDRTGDEFQRRAC